jgi:hypothetical protein
MFAAGRDEMIPREKHMILGLTKLCWQFSSRAIIWLPWIHYRLIRYIQDYFIENILPDIVREKTRFCCKHQRAQFFFTWTIPSVTMLGTLQQKSQTRGLNVFLINFIRQI